MDYFKEGFPYLKLEEPATIGNGILLLNEPQKKEAIAGYGKSIKSGIKPLKFVPASGAASRMFKTLFEGLNKIKGNIPIKEIIEGNNEIKEYIEGIKSFAFYKDLSLYISNAGGEIIPENLIEFLLTGKGLNYGALPKGLLKFHKYPEEERTPFEEHLIEGALYLKDIENHVFLHFTVSPEHQNEFEENLQRIKKGYEEKYSAVFNVVFSKQKPSTDTIAVDTENDPFRNSEQFPFVQTRRAWCPFGKPERFGCRYYFY